MKRTAWHSPRSTPHCRAPWNHWRITWRSSLAWRPSHRRTWVFRWQPLWSVAYYPPGYKTSPKLGPAADLQEPHMFPIVANNPRGYRVQLSVLIARALIGERLYRLEIRWHRSHFARCVRACAADSPVYSERLQLNVCMRESAPSCDRSKTFFPAPFSECF